MQASAWCTRSCSTCLGPSGPAQGLPFVVQAARSSLASSRHSLQVLGSSSVNRRIRERDLRCSSSKAGKPGTSSFHEGSSRTGVSSYQPGQSHISGMSKMTSSSGSSEGLAAPLLPTTIPPPAAAAPAAVVQVSSSPQQKGAKWGRVLAAVGSGVLFYHFVPRPEVLSPQAWGMAGLFLSSVLGLILEPLPAGAVALVALTAGVTTRLVTWEAALAATDNPVIWLILVSFFLAKGFQKTGLGDRIANLFVRSYGRSTLGLAVSLSVAEAALAPAMPSTAARAAGIFMPVITAVSASAGSYPGHPSRTKLGAYLTQSQFQSSVHSSTIVMTAAAQNLLCLQLAAQVGAPVPNAFATWFMAAGIPAMLGVVLTPCVVYLLQPPEVKATPEAPAAAAARLRELGPLKREEWLMLLSAGLATLLWVFGDRLGVAPVVSALLAVCMLLLLGVLEWSDCLSYGAAWDTFLWFSVLISFSMALQQAGVMTWASGAAAAALGSLHLPPVGLFAALHLVFFALHYLFASQTAHVAALYPVFCSLLLATGVLPPALTALSLAFTVNMFGSLTHYASGQAAVFVGAGFLALPEVLVVGAACACVNLLLWGGVGPLVWKFMGLM